MCCLHVREWFSFFSDRLRLTDSPHWPLTLNDIRQTGHCMEYCLQIWWLADWFWVVGRAVHCWDDSVEREDQGRLPLSASWSKLILPTFPCPFLLSLYPFPYPSPSPLPSLSPFHLSFFFSFPFSKSSCGSGSAMSCSSKVWDTAPAEIELGAF